MGLSFASSVLIYVEEEALNKMASRRPSSYLKDLEEISSIIKSPDYVLYREDVDEFYFLKEYLKNHEFKKVLVRIAHLGTPKRWILSSIGLAKTEELEELDVRYGFAKIN